jgi:hypothetical protein
MSRLLEVRQEDDSIWMSSRPISGSMKKNHSFPTLMSSSLSTLSTMPFDPYVSHPNTSLSIDPTIYPHDWFDHTSNVRSTPPDHNHPAVCKNCSSYRCMGADRQFVTAVDNDFADGTDHQRRFEWLWSCIEKAAPEEWRLRRLGYMWGRLIGSDDIWMMWKDDDHLPVAPETRELSAYYDDLWKSASAIISGRLESHYEGHCGFKTVLFNTDSNTLASETFEMRFVAILWKALLACKQMKYQLSPSSVNREIPSLVPKWWDIIPESLKEDLYSTADASQKKTLEYKLLIT